MKRTIVKVEEGIRYWQSESGGLVKSDIANWVAVELMRKDEGRPNTWEELEAALGHFGWLPLWDALSGLVSIEGGKVERVYR